MFQNSERCRGSGDAAAGAGDASVVYLVPGPVHTNKAVHNRRWLCRAVLNIKHDCPLEPARLL